jgi:hypothetical protein
MKAKTYAQAEDEQGILKDERGISEDETCSPFLGCLSIGCPVIFK